MTIDIVVTLTLDCKDGTPIEEVVVSEVINGINKACSSLEQTVRDPKESVNYKIYWREI